MNKNDKELHGFESELIDILESNLSNKQQHVERLASYYKDHQEEIKETFSTWENLGDVEVPALRTEMDDSFYRMLESLPTESIAGRSYEMTSSTSDHNENGIFRLFTPTRLAVAATFVIGMLAGQWMDFGSSTQIDSPQIEYRETSNVQFASLEKTPSAMKRIQGINEVKNQENPDLKIISALNQVILHDPNVNVRLTAIETMVLFSDIPEARAYLIEAIPHQESPIVQLELADIMIALEEKSSADKWTQLLESDKMETETRIHLKESLRKIL